MLIMVIAVAVVSEFSYQAGKLEKKQRT